MGVKKGSILVTPRSFRRIEGAHWDKLRSSPYEVINSPHQDELMTEKEMVDYVKNRDIKGIIVGLDPLTEEVFENANSLEIVAKYGTGLDNIDIEAAGREGITVTYTPGTNTQSVADLTMGLLTGVARWIPYHDRSLRKGRLNRNQGQEIWNKSLGIVGLGRIGVAVVRRARGFNMDTYYYDLTRRELEETALDIDYLNFEDLLTRSDFVSLHCPLTESTRDLMGKRELRKMQESAILVNTARSGLIDEEALLEALTSGEIAGAAVDTFESEDELSSELLQLENFIGSPHAGASTKESVLRMANMATEEVLNVLDGKEPTHLVPALTED
ncbi:phosphoglycerate dehydrogenase [Candidatus Bipolaricaulota bacterium]|nr:phosphoglycerate dehydrogenase [Candidatus Bipolaricaulota bacterium]